MITRCASNCDCPWSFLHSYISNEYEEGKHDNKTRVRRTFLVCNECHEWTGKPVRGCARLCRCHDEARGHTQEVAILAASEVN